MEVVQNTPSEFWRIVAMVVHGKNTSDLEVTISRLVNSAFSDVRLNGFIDVPVLIFPGGLTWNGNDLDLHGLL